MFGEPHLQGAGEASRRVLDEMRQPIVGNRLLPMPQHLPGHRLAGAARTVRDHLLDLSPISEGPTVTRQVRRKLLAC